jgi:serine/threonine protein kinase
MSKTDDRLYLGRYKEIQQLGEGTFGLVTKCIDRHDNDTVVALKKLKSTDPSMENGDIPA